MKRTLQNANPTACHNKIALCVLTYVACMLLCLAINANVALATEQNEGTLVNASLPSAETIFTPSAQSLVTNSSLKGESANLNAVDRITMYRLYNKYTGEHFYTSDESEKNKLVKTGWTDEGIGWYAPSTSDTPVYRLYNPYVSGGDHHYTTSRSECNSLVNAGWKNEGTGWYSADNEDESDRIPLYRQYNPNEKTGTHNYTKDISENDTLVKAGWKAEGIAWYGYSTDTKEINFENALVDTATKTYSGKQQTPSARVVGLKANTDYVVIYGENKDAGTGTILIAGIGNYTGSKTYTFKINPLDISKAYVTLGNSLTYNTAKQTQTVSSVTASGLKLSKSDYTLTGNTATNAGDYKLTVTGKDNFTGKVTKDYTVKKMDISKAGVKLGNALTYNATQQEQKVASVTVESVTLPTSDYAVSDNTGTDAKDYYLKVSASGQNCTGTVSQKFTITQLDITNATVELGDALIYTGSEQPQTISSVKVGEIALEAKDYDLSGNTATNAGTYDTLKIEGKGNFKGTKTSSFTVEKATPVYAPAGLSGYLEEKLSTITLPDPSASETPATSITWTNADSQFSEIGSQTFDVTFTPVDTDNYKTLTDFKVSVEVLKNYYSVKFDANSPSGAVTQVDGESSVTKNLKYESLEDVTKKHTLVSNDFPTTVENTTTNSKYIFAGWSTNKNDKVAKGNTTILTQDEMIENSTTITSDNVTYYAIWMESSGYWMGTKGATAEYDSEAYFAIHDDAYVSASTIESDMDALRDTSRSDYKTVKAKWDGYYNNDVHLYATYAGGETEQAEDDSTSELNKYVEFRIIQIGEHDSDRSAVTFMATHLLPSAYDSGQSAGWGTSALCKRMNSGDIYSKFSPYFVDRVIRATKKYGTGNTTVTSGSYRFWLFSRSELAGPTSMAPAYPITEGSQYAWCSANSIKDSYNTGQAAIANYKTRAGKRLKNVLTVSGGAKRYWWRLRSPHTGVPSLSCYAEENGCIGAGNTTQIGGAMGVVMGFAF